MEKLSERSDEKQPFFLSIEHYQSKEKNL